MIKKLLTIIVLVASLLVFLFLTDPDKLKIGWLILPFIWLFIIIFLAASLVISLVTKKTQKTKRQMFLALIIAIVPCTALLLNSVNQLTIGDSLLIFGFGLLAVFYVGKLELNN